MSDTNHTERDEQARDINVPPKSSGELENPSFREKLADTVYGVYGGAWGNALGIADMLLKVIKPEFAAQTAKLQAEARISELKQWATFFEDSSMNAMSPSERLRKRIAQLEREHKIGEDGE